MALCTLKHYDKKCFVQICRIKVFNIHRAVKSFLAEMFLASSLTVDRLSTNRCHFFLSLHCRIRLVGHECKLRCTEVTDSMPKKESYNLVAKYKFRK